MQSRSVMIVALSACACGSPTVPDPPTPTPTPRPTMPASCAAPTGGGTDHSGSIGASEAWTAAASPHRIATDVTVSSAATLTLEACTIVELAPGASLRVDGKLVARGALGRPVVLLARDAQSPWRALDVRGGQLDLEYTRVADGGLPEAGDPELSAMVMVRGPSARQVLPEPVVRMVEVQLEGSASVGLQLVDSAAFRDDSRRLTITRSALHPLALEPLAAGSVPPASSYSGNGADVVEVVRKQLAVPGTDVRVTLKRLDVPYRLGAKADPNPALILGNLGEPTPATLTIEAGTVLRVRPGFRLDVVGPGPALSGSLVAVGTAQDPIVFTSDTTTPVAGDWVGLFFRGLPRADTRLEHVVVEYAGNSMTSIRGSGCGTPPAPDMAQNMGAIVVLSGAAPERAFVTESTIRHSASNGVDRAYRDDREVDFVATNTVEQVAYCTQTTPRDAGNGCPNPVPCPRAQ